MLATSAALSRVISIVLSTVMIAAISTVAALSTLTTVIVAAISSVEALLW